MDKPGRYDITSAVSSNQKKSGLSPGGLISVVAAVFTSACSFTRHEPEPNAELTCLEIYLARGALDRSEFEHYKLFGKDLYIECGEVKRGRHKVVFQTLLPVPPGQQTELDAESYRVYRVAESGGLSLAAPGKAQGFADPGHVLITVGFDGKEKDLKTSLDSLVNQEGAHASELGRFASFIRSFARRALGGAPLCGNGTFYGLP